MSPETTAKQEMTRRRRKVEKEKVILINGGKQKNFKKKSMYVSIKIKIRPAKRVKLACICRKKYFEKCTAEKKDTTFF